MFEIVNARTWILILEMLALMIVPKKKTLIYLGLALFTVIVLFFLK